MNKKIYKTANMRKFIFSFALLIFISNSIFAQKQILAGRVVDESGNPIMDAVVNVSEEHRIALTDKDGYFKLKDVKDADKLNISCVGYQIGSAIVDFSKNLNVITLKNDISEYSKSVPVAFNRIPSKYEAGAISSVTGEELVKHPVTVLQNAFTSTVTGVETYEAQSEPGWSETNMYIRGIHTMNSNARSPLIIVDGVERDLSFLDAFPIEKITILKDAAATAIYGMRGANGVVLVTTKRGEPGRTKISFTQEVGYQTPSGIPGSQDSYNYALTRNQADYLDGKSSEFSDKDIECYKEVCDGKKLEGMEKYKYFNTNWYNVMLRDAAPMVRTNLTLSGGNDVARYFVAFSYLRQEGLFNEKWTKWNSGYNTQEVLNRYNLRSNVDVNVNKFLNVSVDLGGRIDNIIQPGIDVWNLFTWGAGENLPIYPVFCPNGEFFMPTTSDSKNGAAQIAGRGIERNRRRNLYSTMTATGDFGSLYKPLSGLKAHVTVSFDSYETFQSVQQADIDCYYYNFTDNVDNVSDYKYTRIRTASPLPNPTTSPRDYYYNINTNTGLDYNHIFGKHYLSAQAFMRTYKDVVRGQNSSNRYISYNAQGTYVYNKRYVLGGSFSRMGCDNFAPGRRFGNFYSVSGAWVLSDENWLKDSFVNLLKLRTSYGLTGQSEIGANRYPYQSTFAEGNGYNFGTGQSSYSGAYESAAGNKNIKWEKSKEFNIGLDFDLWNKELSGSIDVFKEWRSDILVTPSNVSTILGIDAPQDSRGKAETKGFELTLSHQNKIGRDFEYFINGMVTFNTNKIVDMDEVEPTYAYQRKTGHRIDENQMLIWKQWASNPNYIPTSQADAIQHPEKYPYHAAGVYKLGNAIFQDTNGDGIINSYDMVPKGYSNIPELIPSINLGFIWKGFDARTILTAYLLRTVTCRENMDYGFGWGGTSTPEVTKTWGYYTDDPSDIRNIKAKYPRLSTSFSDIDRNYPYNQSTIWIRNGDFLSLRNIEVGYSLPKKLIAKASMTKCRFYFSGYNLCNWSHLPKGFDPENPTNYIWAYPKTRSFSFGVNLEF